MGVCLAYCTLACDQALVGGVGGVFFSPAPWPLNSLLSQSCMGASLLIPSLLVKVPQPVL